MRNSGVVACHALWEFLDNVFEAVNKNKVFLAIFLDFSNSFDTVDQKSLKRELQFYGVRCKSSTAHNL